MLPIKLKQWCYRSVSEFLIDYWHGCYIHHKVFLFLSYVSRRAYTVCYGVYISEYTCCFLHKRVYWFCFSLDIEDFSDLISDTLSSGWSFERGFQQGPQCWTEALPGSSAQWNGISLSTVRQLSAAYVHIVLRSSFCVKNANIPFPMAGSSSSSSCSQDQRGCSAFL